MKKVLVWLTVLAAAGCTAWLFVGAAGPLMRIRVLMGAVSIGVFCITLVAIRNYKLQEQYAGLWLATAAMLTLAAFFPQVMDLARQWLGMPYTAAVVAVVFVFLVLVAFHFSIALSALNDKLAATAARGAILEARICDLERRLGADSAAVKEGTDERGPAAGR